jgi:mono/diheme cytochrome c family protein
VVLAQGGESDVCHQLNAGVELAADDGPRPWLRGVEGYRHADLSLVQAVGRGQSAMVDWSIPVVAKTDECVV